METCPVKSLDQAAVPSGGQRGAAWLLGVCVLCLGLLTGCVYETWQLSTVSRAPNFEIRRPNEVFAKTSPATIKTNSLLYLEPGPNLVDYAYNAEEHALEITLEVNRNHTLTVSGAYPGTGKQVRLRNLQHLPRSIRFPDSTGAFRIGSRVPLVSKPGSREERAYSLLLGLQVDTAASLSDKDSKRPELLATLQSLIVYDYDHNRIVAEWTRQEEPPSPPRE